MFDINNMSPKNGRILKEDNNTVNEGDFINDVWDKTNHVVKTSSSGGGGGGAVTVADGADVTLGAKADAAVTNPATTASLISLIKGLLTALQSGFVGVGNPPSGYPLTVAGFDGTNKQYLRTDTLGRLQVGMIDTTATGSISAQNTNSTGTASANSAVVLTGQNNNATVSIHVTANTLNQVLTPKISLDGTNWVALSATGLINQNTGVYSATIGAGVSGFWQAAIGADYAFRIECDSSCTGSATVNLQSSPAPSAMAIDQPLPPGTNTIGALVANQSVNLSQIAAGTAITGGVTGSLAVGGNVAVGGSVAGNPVQLGASCKTAQPTAQTDGKVVGLVATTDGKLVQMPYATPDLSWQYTTSSTAITTNTSTAMKAAGASGIRNYVTGFSYQNTSATASLIEILDGSTVIWIGNAPASMTQQIQVPFPSPLRGTAATAMNVQLVTTGTSTYVNAQGFQGA